MFAAVAVVGITSCSESAIDENLDTNQPSVEQNKGEGSCLFASIDNGSATRVSMTDNGTTGLSFAWEAGDVITINVAGTDYTYTCEDASTGKFTCDDAPAFVDGDNYTASFGDATPAASQDNTDDSFSSSESLRLEASFTYTEGEDITLTFNGVYPIITITKPVDSSVYDGNISVTFRDGDTSYEAGGVIDNGILKASIVINRSSGERDLVFMLKNNATIEEAYIVKSVNKSYEACTRYTADLSKLTHQNKIVVLSEDSYDGKTIPAFLEGLPVEQKNNAKWYLPGTDVPEKFKDYIKTTSSFSQISLICPDITKIDKSQFGGRKALSSISCPKVTSIGDGAFNGCVNLVTLDFPNATSVGKSAFNDCNSLTKVSFPKVTNIGASAFRSCDKIESLDFPIATTIGDTAFYNCRSNNFKRVSFPLVETIGRNAFGACVSLADIDFPEATKIGEKAFFSCSGLRDVTFLNVTAIGKEAFYGCTGLQTVSFPNATTIGESAFIKCPLVSAEFPAAKIIGKFAFKSCLLTSAEFPNVTEIGISAFQFCESLKDLNFPNAKKIGDSAFNQCEVLDTVFFPKVTNVGPDAFSFCKKLAKIDFPKLTKIGSFAFRPFTFIAPTLKEVRLTASSDIVGEEGAFMNPSNCDLYLSPVNFAKANGKSWAGLTWKSINKVE